ncbi:MAG: RNase adapter RapZ [bacterium]
MLQSEQIKTVLIVTGCSGGGKTSVMRVLEDLGFYCVDNLPVPLFSNFFHLAFEAQSNLTKIALGIDARGGKQFLSNFILEVDNLRRKKETNVDFKIIFLNASDSTLVKRFQETRRKHPLADRGVSLLNAIQKEKELLEPVMGMSEIILDTDEFNIHDLRKWVRNSFSAKSEQEILVNIISFGFKYGVPKESNLVYDLRFLPNPFFVPELKKIDGRSSEVQNYLFTKPDVQDYWRRLISFLEYSIKKSYKEGRFFVNVSVGCTGGKHRSVAFAEKLAKQNWENVRFLIHHRDLGKE